MTSYDPEASAAEVLSTIDPSTVNSQRVEQLDNAAVKQAFRSVLRNRQSTMMHSSHNSHSNTVHLEQ